jgi:hypothetical protein
MDFIIGLPCTSHGYNSIWIIVDRLTKSACFIPVSTTYRVRQYVELYISHIVRYHGIPKTIISDRGSIFVARLWDGPKWGKHLPLAEFSYNKSYKESIKMSHFEVLYG